MSLQANNDLKSELIVGIVSAVGADKGVGDRFTEGASWACWL